MKCAKRILTALLAVFMAMCLLAGCGASKEEETQPQLQETEPETTQSTEESTVPEEPDVFYVFFDDYNGEKRFSEVKSYQNVTGAQCQKSAIEWDFLYDEEYENVTEGYDAGYSLFLYPYEQAQYQEYITYLTSEAGFTFDALEGFDGGTSYYYYDSDNGLYLDIFVAEDSSYVVINPTCRETSQCYKFYDYENGVFLDSQVMSYQDVTGAECQKSVMGWDFLYDEEYADAVDGYDEDYGIYIYAYDLQQHAEYMGYLAEAGFVVQDTVDYDQGSSYFYYNAENGYYIDLFLSADIQTIVIEPYIPAEETEAIDETEPTAAAEITSFYYFYDYSAKEYLYSDVGTYQGVTGGVCLASALDFGFIGNDSYEEISEGYDDRYAVFIYEYDEGLLNLYKQYLESLGYQYASTEEYMQGTSDFYENASNGYMIDLFVGTGDDGSAEYLAIEPYIPGVEDETAGEKESAEITSFYDFYDYAAREYLTSEVGTYHAVTGGVCLASTLDFGFLSDENYEDISEGYDERYAVFIYEYDEELLELYKQYLEDLGYHYVNTVEYNEGVSEYYQNPSNGYTFDLFVGTSDDGTFQYLAIEPYLNGNTE